MFGEWAGVPYERLVRVVPAAVTRNPDDPALLMVYLREENAGLHAALCDKVYAIAVLEQRRAAAALQVDGLRRRITELEGECDTLRGRARRAPDEALFAYGRACQLEQQAGNSLWKRLLGPILPPLAPLPPLGWGGWR